MKTNRLARVMAGMERMNLKQLLVTSTESIYYLTGQWIAPGERLLALFIGESGPKLFVNHMFAVPPVEGLELVEFDDSDDSVAALAAFVAPGAIGVDKAWPSRFLLSLMEKRSDVLPVIGSKPVDDARMLKDDEEIAALRMSSRTNDRVTGALRKSLVEGETELDVARRYEAIAASEGATGLSFSALICFGAGCAEPHHATGKARLQKGDAVILDVGVDVDHALSDMTRGGQGGGAAGRQALRHRPGGAVGHRGRGIRQAFSAPHGPRAGPRGARAAGCQRCQPLRGAAGHGVLHRAGHLPAWQVRRPGGGPGIGHRGRLRVPERAGQGFHDRIK